jgi:hypothetical protein
VELTVLAVPGCPNAAVLDERLALVAAGLPGVSVIRRFVEDEQEAVALGMHGSPTLLIDRTDPFAVPGQPAGLTCRLYLQADGSLRGAPSVESLRRALEHDAPTATSPSRLTRQRRDASGSQAEC